MTYFIRYSSLLVFTHICLMEIFGSKQMHVLATRGLNDMNYKIEVFLDHTFVRHWVNESIMIRKARHYVELANAILETMDTDLDGRADKIRLGITNDIELLDPSNVEYDYMLNESSSITDLAYWMMQGSFYSKSGMGLFFTYRPFLGQVQVATAQTLFAQPFRCLHEPYPGQVLNFAIVNTASVIDGPFITDADPILIARRICRGFAEIMGVAPKPPHISEYDSFFSIMEDQSEDVISREQLLLLWNVDELLEIGLSSWNSRAKSESCWESKAKAVCGDKMRTHDEECDCGEDMLYCTISFCQPGKCQWEKGNPLIHITEKIRAQRRNPPRSTGDFLTKRFTCERWTPKNT